MIKGKGGGCKPRTGVNISCVVCSKVFYVVPGRKETAKYCSYDCIRHRRFEGLRHIYSCVTCGKECESPPSKKKTRKKYCSFECKEICWKDREQRRLEYNAKRRLKPKERLSSTALKKYVLSTRGAICEVCGYKDHICCIEIHHIDEDPTNNDPKNIRVCCCNCHRRHHRGDLKPIPELDHQGKEEKIK